MQFANVPQKSAQACQAQGITRMSAIDVKRYEGGVPVEEEAVGEGKRQPRILAVGELRKWQHAGRELPQDRQIGFADFFDVSPELLEALAPDVIMSPLLTASFDCLDLAQLLQHSGFRGRYRILAPDLPNPAVVAAEIEALCPSLDIGFLIAGEMENFH